MGSFYKDGKLYTGRVEVDTNQKVKDYFEGNSNTTKNYNENMSYFSIINDGASDLTFTINGFTITVKSGEEFNSYFEDFTTVNVTSSVSYRALVKG